MVKIVVRKADGSEVEVEVPVLNAGVIRLDGELYSLDRMTTDRAISSGKRTAYFVPAEASFLEDVGIDAIVYLDPKGEFDPDGIISCELREAMKGWILEL